MNELISPKKTLLIANGAKPERELFEKYRRHATTIIALDGADSWLRSNGIAADVVIGDMDSADRVTTEQKNVLRNLDQNSNDLEKALGHCLAQGLTKLSVLGAFGLRHDHFLTNVFVINKFASALTITLADGEQCAFICPTDRPLTIENQCGSFISLFPLAEDCGPLWSSGVDYPLVGEMLGITTRIGTLNRINQAEASVRCTSGNLLVFLPNFFAQSVSKKSQF